MTNSAEPIDSIQYTITGKLPAPGASTWQGTYTIVNSPSSTCVFNFSGSFTATAYPTLNGTYAGTIDGSGLGSGISITLKVSQDEQTLEQSMNGAVTYIPLSGTITVTGSSCFTSGTIVNGQVSQIDADTFMMWASMNDGSTMEIHGWVSDQTEATLTPVDVVIKNGACANAFGSGTLNR
ncbi:MAG TPA: hypothetical protein VJX73_09035 [Terracidiphilus sp.]|nr:hypothetical protein [Terracidiphilus sp.]